MALATLLDRQSGQIRSQDAGSLAFAIAKNPVGGEIVFNYLLSNWDTILKSFSSEQSILNKIIEAFISPIRTRHELEQLEKWLLAEKSTEKYYKFTESLMTVKQKVDWLEKQGADLAKLLDTIRRD